MHDVRKHELPALPYAPGALEPHISRETLEYHYGRHHRKYVETLNSLVAGTEFEGAALEDIVRRATGAIFNNAAQAWNHGFYWRCMAPGGGEPGGELAAQLKAAFGSIDGFREQFRRAAGAKFGSGWTWLARTGDGRLVIHNTDDADTPLRQGAKPLLVCDVWEHAYYIDYRNERPRYVDAFLSVLNWRFAESNLTR